MKKYWIVPIIISFTFVSNLTIAQNQRVPFFNEKGTVRIQTTELDAMADTIATVNHRADDVVWSRIIYRIIDLREKQNFQLYFPTRPNDEYRSLFRVILDAIANKTKPLTVYSRSERELKPLFQDEFVLKGISLSNVFAFSGDSTDVKIDPEKNIVRFDSVKNSTTVENTYYNDYVNNQYKYLIQEIVFFDKHTSRMYTKIMAIAPLYGASPYNKEKVNAWKYFQNSILCWILFDDLRPYMAKQYVIPNGNETQRLTYDEFFAQKLYSSYILGDGNMSNKMLLQDFKDPDKIRKEQKRIETEILNTEQDLWEY
ncbi:MAG: gliding motility protein GldN [Paludibacter sp.]